MSYNGQKLTGIVVPMVTPLNRDGSLDLTGLKSMLEHEISGGVSGIFILGSTGEGPALKWDLRREMVCATVALLQGRLPLLVNISSESADESISFAQFCEQHGADAVVASPPCYLVNEGEELIAFFKGITEAIKLPVYVYNMPELTKIFIPLKEMEVILEIPGIAGVKDSSGDMAFFKELVSKNCGREDLSIFMGPDALTLQALQLGADGGVNSGANLRPEIYSGLYRSVKAGSATDAERFQLEILALQEVYKGRPGSAGVLRGLKKALAEKGLLQNFLAFPGIPS